MRRGGLNENVCPVRERTLHFHYSQKCPSVFASLKATCVLKSSLVRLGLAFSQDADICPLIKAVHTHPSHIRRQAGHYDILTWYERILMSSRISRQAGNACSQTTRTFDMYVILDPKVVTVPAATA